MVRREKYYVRPKKSEGRKITVYHLDMVFFLTFFVGILWANLLGENSKNRFFMLNEYYIQQLKYTKVDGTNLLLYILEKRIPILILLVLLSFTLAGILTQVVFVSYFGASFGFLCVMAITNFGWKGLVYVGGFLFPHYIFYLIWYLLFLKVFKNVKEGIPTGKKEYLMQAGILTLIMIVGILFESYVNPVFLQKILKIF